ncbi:MAG TPA: sodium:solute symporter family protein [Ignavibacteria bacterium]|nr:sodium:solute symporter family protein [Ignavibacteria bacterium]
MQIIDWVIIVLYFLISLAIGLYYSKRAGKDTESFFLSGRNLSWWLAGISMVATTFAADTPLAVTELVGQNGIAGNWLWWNMLIGGMLTVFFFARLWRRANILTDIEFIELRYSGKLASFLRGFKGIYMGVVMNTIIMGWVNLAMIKILLGMFPEYVNESNVLFYVGACMLITAVYSALSGLWGVAVTDAFQFCLAMAGCIILAIIVVNEPAIGGISGLKAKLPDWALQFTPTITSAESSIGAGGVLALTISSFLAFIGIQWWASWYPGAEPGGGGYIAQRMMSAKDEKNSLLATLFFQIAHYCIRPWPWIIVGLCAIVLYPELSMADKGMGFVRAMNDYLPAGLKGLLLAAFFAAYMSTIATHLNWGTSYFVNDFYRRFLKKNETEKHYVSVSKIMTIVFMFLSIIVTTQMTSISGVWSFVIECGAGLGLVLILRWYWWRVNAVSEIVATITPFVVYSILKFGFPEVAFPTTLYIIVPATTIVWLIATFLSKPVEESKLIEFYKRVHPGGIGWKKISNKLPDVKSDSGYFYLMLDWAMGVILVYMFLFGMGKIIFGEIGMGLLFIAIGLAAGYVIVWSFNKMGWEKLK